MEDRIDIPEFDTIWNYNNPLQTEIKFREILPNIKGSGNRSHYLQLLTQIARAEGLQSRFDDAHHTLNEVEKLLNQDLHTAGIRCILERGRLFNSSGQKDRAREYFLKAWELGNEYGEDFYAVDAAHMMAIIEIPEEAIKWNEMALELAERSDNPRAKKWLGSLYNNMGWAYHDMNDFEKAYEYFKKAEEWHAERNSGEGYRIAKWTVGRVLRSLGKTGEALEKQKALLKEIEEKGVAQDGYVYEEIAECSLVLGNKDEAKKHFGLAYEHLSKDRWLSANEKERLSRLKRLSENIE
jgi:tetratricopeptide (TPR) repeat protein